MTSGIKTAFITGAGSGIGRALAEALADEGAALYLTDINAANLAEVAEALRAKQVNVHSAVMDVSDRAAFERTAADAISALGHVDAVFNNAGVSLSDTVGKMSYDDLEWLMGINFYGVVYGTKAFLPHMLARKSGHIINVSSIFGIIGVPSQSAYCAAKHAVKGFNDSLFYELDGTGVQVHSVHPGGVDTGIVRHGRHRHNVRGAVDTDEVQEGFSTFAISTPAQAAETILNGVAKGTYRIFVGRDAVFFDRFQRWAPKLWMKRFLNNMRKSGKGGF